MKNGKNLIIVSQSLLVNLKSNLGYIHNVETLGTIPYNDLVKELDNDDRKNAFWINIYNSFMRIKIKNPKDMKTYPKFEFFSKDDIKISNLKLSLDDIEHKILRKSKLKLFRGYVTNIFAYGWERELRVKKLDNRIHFALNCGARSCPPISSYDDETISKQFEVSKKNFILNDSKFDSSTNTLSVSRIFFWYLGDFQGKKGVIEIHREIGIVPKDLDPGQIKLSFNTYTWEIL